MASAQEDLTALVSKLESHLNQTELQVKAQLRIASTSDDAELDDLFLSPDFQKSALISAMPILRPQTSPSIQDLEATEARCLQQASVRLKAYLESLNDHIVKIVESESDEFLTVAQKLEAFKTMLRDLKDSVGDFKTRFTAQKESTWQVLGYMASQYEELRDMIGEKRRLESLMQLQEMYGELEVQVRGCLATGDQIDIEGCARMLDQLKQNAKEARDPSFNQQLQLLERQILQRQLTNFEAIINGEDFKALINLNLDEDSLYFLECELSSIFRVFKLCDQQKLLMDKIQSLIMKPQLNIIVKRCYDQKNYQNPATVPLELFTQSVITDLLNGSLKTFFNLTHQAEGTYNFVSGYDLLRDCLWGPLTQVIDQSLSFVFSSANYTLFHRNYLVTKDFLALLNDLYASKSKLPNDYLDDFLGRFNLQTYFNVLQIEITEKYVAEIDRVYDQTNDQLKPVNQITMQYCLRVMGDGVYMAEIGDKMIKLAVQLVVRHINWVMDKVNEKKSIATERILYILEDLNQLKRGVEDQLMPLICQRIRESSPELSGEDIYRGYLSSLLHDLSQRFDHLMAPCLSSLSQRLSQRLLDNLAGFKTFVPQHYRMTNRTLTSPPAPSPFLEHLLRPLHSLNDQKLFQTLSQEVKCRIYESVLDGGYRELAKNLQEVINEEGQMHESLKKYKREEGGMSDFDKMLVQYYVDVEEMGRQADLLLAVSSDAQGRKYDRHLLFIKQLLEPGRVKYEALKNLKS